LLASASVVPFCALSSADTISVRLDTSPSLPSSARWPSVPAVMIPPEHAAITLTDARLAISAAADRASSTASA
jgi:hypothetical protein